MNKVKSARETAIETSEMEKVDYYLSKSGGFLFCKRKIVRTLTFFRVAMDIKSKIQNAS